MHPQLRLLIDLQDVDVRTAALEREAARLPKEIEAIQAALVDARSALEAARTRLDGTKKSVRAKEKDLDVSAAKRAKAEARLYEVKTNKEYSAVLAEIEEIKQEKSRIEEEILSLMETQERLTAEIREAEERLRGRESEGKAEEAVIGQRLQTVESELEVIRARRASVAREVTSSVLVEYDKLLKARGGLAVAQALPSQTCAGCRMAIRPQALLEIRAQTHLIACENCGRYLYWAESA